MYTNQLLVIYAETASFMKLTLWEHYGILEMKQRNQGYAAQECLEEGCTRRCCMGLAELGLLPSFLATLHFTIIMLPILPLFPWQAEPWEADSAILPNVLPAFPSHPLYITTPSVCQDNVPCYAARSADLAAFSGHVAGFLTCRLGAVQGAWAIS